MADSKKDGEKDDFAATMAKNVLIVAQYIAKGLETDKASGKGEKGGK